MRGNIRRNGVFAIWKGKLPREILEVGQQGYSAAEPVVYPEGIEVIDCGLGTNPLGMSDALKRFLAAGKDTNLCDYPTPEPEALKEALAEAYPAWNLAPDRLFLSGGSMGVLLNLARVLFRPGSLVSGVSPQFTDTGLQALYNGALYRPIRLEPPRYAIGTARLMEELEKKPDVLYLDRPNNPTGQVFPLEEFEKVAKVALETGTWVISDEAYGDFIPDSESAACLDLPNVVTCRSFSKGRGAAGIRVGFAVVRDPDLDRLLKTVQPAFAVGTLDAEMAAAALGDTGFLERTLAYVRLAKGRTLEAIEARPEWSVADTDPRTPILLLSQESGSLVNRLAAVGISCEAGTGFFDLDDRSVRLRVPAPEKLDAFLERLAKA